MPSIKEGGEELDGEWFTCKGRSKMSFLEVGSWLAAELWCLRTMTNLKINFIGINMLSLPLLWL